MTWGIVAGAAVGLVGSAVSANAASDAADTQAQATRDANALTQDQAAQMRTDLSPYRDYGAGATNKLALLLGTGDRSQMEFASPAANGEVDRLARDRARQRAIQQVAQSWGASDPNVILNNPAGAAEVDRLTQITSNDRLEARQQVTAGWGNPDISSEYGSLTKNFTGADLVNEPGYQVGLSEGTKALQSGIAAKGGLFSGAAGKALLRYGNDYASTKFGDAFNRDSANKTRTYNFLSGGASLGENAAAQSGNAGMNMAQQVGANTTANANAQGAAGIAGANAFSSAINNGWNNYQQNELMKRLQTPSSNSYGGANSYGWGTGAGYGNQDYGQYF